MKKKNFLMLLGLAGLGLTARAQVATLGFEDGDKQYHHPDSAAFAGFYGDHINLQPGDVWNEKCEEAHTGKYALDADNSQSTERGQTWFRGLKLRGLEVAEGKSYRVSFWVKADKTFTSGEETLNTAIKSTLSIGRENLEAPLVSQSGAEYYYNWTDGIMTGDWRRLSFVAFNSGKAVQDKYFDKYDDNIKDVVPDPSDSTKVDTIWWKGDDTSFPETYFLTINMYNPVRYLLDDITIEEATMAGCTYNYNAIRVDFGYPTNVAELASASTDPLGTYLLPASCVKVTNGGEDVPVASVELKQDGYMYVFLEDDVEDPSGILVSFTPGDDCPVVYNTDRRPSMDVESEMKVLGFTDEKIYLDEDIDEMSYTQDAPTFLSSVPEDHSFELVAADLKEVRLTYDRPVGVDIASTMLTKDGEQVSTPLPTVAPDDPNTVVVTFEQTLADGEYRLEVASVTNIESGVPVVESQTVNFSIGPDESVGGIETIYSSDSVFAATANGAYPLGWLSFDQATGIHQYGKNSDGSDWNYNYGGTINDEPGKGNGGPRMMTGYSGDFNGGALYWRATDGVEGRATFGEQVKDNVNADGTVKEDLDPKVTLYLTPRKYQVSFRMAAWKAFDDGSFPKYDFSLMKIDLSNPSAESEPVAQFNGVEAKPNVNGTQDIRVDGATLSVTDFTVEEEGYYYMKFSCVSRGGYEEFLLGAVDLVTKPSDAAYYKAQLAEALTAATAVLEDSVADAAYDGETKTKLAAAVKRAKEEHFTSPSAIAEIKAELEALSAAMLSRKANIDQYGLFLQTLKDNMAGIEAGTKYTLTDEYKEGEEMIGKYDGVSSSSLPDDELASAVKELDLAAGKAGNIKGMVDALAYRLTKSAETARTIGTALESAVTAAEQAVTDDDDVAEGLNRENKLTLYKSFSEKAEIADDWKTEAYSETEADSTEEGGFKLLTSGLEVTGFVKNPQFYTYATSTENLNPEITPGWELTEGSSPAHMWQNFLAEEKCPVKNSVVNAYRGHYTMRQEVSGLPVGVYDVHMRTRTAVGMNAGLSGDSIPDLYMWVSTAEGDTLRAAYPGGATNYDPSKGGFPTIIKGVTVEEGTVLSIGVRENCISGGTLNGDGTPQGSWDTNTYADDVRLFLVAPLAGFDYGKAYTDGVEAVKAAEVLSREYYTPGGVRLSAPAKGVNIVKSHRADGTTEVKKIVVK